MLYLDCAKITVLLQRAAKTSGVFGCHLHFWTENIFGCISIFACYFRKRYNKRFYGLARLCSSYSYFWYFCESPLMKKYREFDRFYSVAVLWQYLGAFSKNWVWPVLIRALDELLGGCLWIEHCYFFKTIEYMEIKKLQFTGYTREVTHRIVASSSLIETTLWPILAS